jgi:hypothetical protein
MKLAILASIPFVVANAFAQSFNFVAPPFGSAVTAGVPFPVTLQLHRSFASLLLPVSQIYMGCCLASSSSMKLVTLYYGFQTGGDPSNEALGDELAAVLNPTFTVVGGALVNNVNLTIPTARVTGQVNLTCGIFYTIGVSFYYGLFIGDCIFNDILGSEFSGNSSR